MIYRRRSSPLHAAGAGAGMAFCAALAACALLLDHPVVLAALLVAVLAAGALAGVGGELRRATRFALPLAALIALINPLVSREGLTVIARGGKVPVLGHLDITLEAVAYGAVLGLRALVVLLCCALYSAAVDPDEVLRLFRRVSFRSALTATLATRMLPVLARDARRLSEAQRCLPGRAAPRLAIARAVAGGALERAVDVAATLEVRGYGGAHRPPRRHAVRSRHDLAFLAASGALMAVALGATALGVAAFDPYPELHARTGLAECGLAIAMLAGALAPFAQRRGVGS